MGTPLDIAFVAAQSQMWVFAAYALSRNLMTTPPRIVRPEGGPPSEARLVAEARAIAVPSVCLPCNDGGIAGRFHALDFGAGWRTPLAPSPILRKPLA